MAICCIAVTEEYKYDSIIHIMKCLVSLLCLKSCPINLLKFVQKYIWFCISLKVHASLLHQMLIKNKSKSQMVKTILLKSKTFFPYKTKNLFGRRVACVDVSSKSDKGLIVLTTSLGQMGMSKTPAYVSCMPWLTLL